MKKRMYILLLIACMTGALLTSCGSSKPCPAYKSVTSENLPYEAPLESEQAS